MLDYHKPGRRIGNSIEDRAPAIAAGLDTEKLKEAIALPDWEKRLRDLFLFRGGQSPYRTRALFNVAYGMFLSECDSWGLGAVAIGTGDVGHLCGLHNSGVRGPQSMRSVFSRLRGCPKVTDSFSRAFTEYVEWLHPYPCVMTRVPYEEKHWREGVTAWWRIPAPKQSKKWRMPEPRSVEVAYPYIRAPRSADHQLLLDVHARLPKGLPHEIRGDLCQDLIVAVLSGETTIDNIPDVVAQYARAAKKMLPDKWKTVSLDAPIFDDGERDMHEVIGGHGHDECGGDHHHYADESDALLTALDR